MASLQLVKYGSASNPRSSSTPPKPLPLPAPNPTPTKPLDPNMSNPRLLVNRPCIYERKLPGDAYITAHVQRLQHGYYSSETMSDIDAEHVDFLAVSFIFHASNTQNHRFKSATIRASICGEQELLATPPHHGDPSANPRFLMHAPHLIFGSVSPETMQWTFSLAGSLGISEGPASASVIPSGSINKQYRRYEMMRVQGSSRTRKSAKGPQYDVEAGEIFWSLEENNLQRSGLPREFTFVMLVQKPTADSKVNLKLNIEPVLQARLGNYPSALLSCPPYQPLARPGVNFCREVGQKFEPRDPVRGFNFAALESSFDDYITMPGRKFTRTVEIPPETQLPQTNGPQGYPGQYGNQYGAGQYTYGQYNMLNPVQQLQREGFSFQDNMTGNLLQSQLRQMQAVPQFNTSTAATQTNANNGLTMENLRNLAAATQATANNGNTTDQGNSTAAMPATPERSNIVDYRIIQEGLNRSPLRRASDRYSFYSYYDSPRITRVVPNPYYHEEDPSPYYYDWRSIPQPSLSFLYDRPDPNPAPSIDLGANLPEGWVGRNRPTSRSRARELGGKVYAESERDAVRRRKTRSCSRAQYPSAPPLDEESPLRPRRNRFDRTPPGTNRTPVWAMRNWR